MIESIPPLSTAAATMNGLPPLAGKTMGIGTNIDAVAQDFEAMFATQLLQPMFETVKVDGMFGGGHGEEVMRSFLLQEYGKMIAKTGMLGIGTQVKAEMLRAQEGAKAKGAKIPMSKAQDAYAAATTANANYTAEVPAHVTH